MSVGLFENVLPKLHVWLTSVIDSLSHGDRQREQVELKIEIERAIKCLEFCQQYDLHTAVRVVVMPDASTMSASSEFRIVEDIESDDKQHWLEVIINGELIRPLPGSLIIEKGASRPPAAK